jgi:diacylglycerol kinase (ATP)
MLRAVCIYNPASRKAPDRTVLNEVKSILGGCGYDLDLWSTEYPLHATHLARKAVAANPHLIIVCGGDGTINEVIGGMALSRIPLAIVPSGTGNVLADELKLPQSVLPAAAEIARSKPVRIALGKAGNRFFILMAGVGVDASIIYDLDTRLKQRLGEVAFWFEGFRHWFKHRFVPLTVEVNGRSYECTFAIIARSAAYGGRLKIASRAHLLQDGLDVCMFSGTSRLRYLHYVLAVLSGTHLRLPGVIYVHGTEVYVVSDHRIKVQVDGELAGELPMRFEIVPDALTLLVPPAYLARHAFEK